MQRLAGVVQHLGLAIEHEHHRPPAGHDAQRFVGGVEHEGPRHRRERTCALSAGTGAFRDGLDLLQAAPPEVGHEVARARSGGRRARRRPSRAGSGGSRGRAAAGTAGGATTRAGPARTPGGRPWPTATGGAPRPARPARTSSPTSAPTLPMAQDRVARAPAARPRRRRRAGRRRRGPPGTMRAPRAKSRRAERSSSAWAAAKKASPKPSATEPATTARRRSSRFATEATRPADEPARPAPAPRRRPPPPVARCGRRSRCPTPRPRGSPRAPQAHGRPSGSTMTWPMCPALPSAPSRRRPSSTMPPPTPVDTTMAMKSRCPGRRPEPALAQGERLGVVVDVDGQARAPRPAGARSGNPRHAGDVQRRHRPRRRAVIGPPEPTPQATSSPRPDLADGLEQRREHGLAVARRGGPRWPAPRSRPSSSTRAAASFVPPMSTARIVAIDVRTYGRPSGPSARVTPTLIRGGSPGNRPLPAARPSPTTTPTSSPTSSR